MTGTRPSSKRSWQDETSALRTGWLDTLVKDGEEVGRQSGSLQWRLNRGEIRAPDVRRLKGCDFAR